MTRQICGFCLLAVLFSPFAHGQDSAMQAAPGSGPPPQGWTAELPPDSGIHAPVKKKKMRLQLKSADDKTPQPESSPAADVPSTP